MTATDRSHATVLFDGATRALVRLSARIAAGSELDVRDGLNETVAQATPPVWVEELILQSYLFAGFPRTLNAAREWRRSPGGSAAGAAGAADAADAADAAAGAGAGESATTGSDEVAGQRDVKGSRRFRSVGEATCARVYGVFYEKLRHNIAELHPELDDWMIEEGYGKVLSRPGLDLPRRELCIVAACVAAGQDRQLHSHLHGARNVGAPDATISATLQALDGVVVEQHRVRAEMLWARVAGK